MWAQIVKSRMKPGAEDRLLQLDAEMSGQITQRGGWLQTIVLRDQKNPEQTYAVVLFESEDAARASESSPEVQEFARRIQSNMEGQPEFIDCDVLLHRQR